MEQVLVGATALLSVFATDPAPWRDIQSNSDMRQPVYLGATPREMAIHGNYRSRIELPAPLKAIGERQAKHIAAEFSDSAIELEAWPVNNDDGQRTWAFARWRNGPEKAWKWIDADRFDAGGLPLMRPAPTLPQALRVSKKKDRSLVFDDALMQADLYDKPFFSSCVWSGASDSQPFAAWLPVDQREASRAKLASPRADNTCQVIPQPARFNNEPVSFVIDVRGSKVTWPEWVSWRDENESLPEVKGKRVLGRFPKEFAKAYRDDVITLSGEKDAVFPRSGRVARFLRKNSAQPDHQLLDLVGYLEERYAQLGIRTRRHEFEWRGIPQANLIAVIPGSLEGDANKPVLMGDHIDTAFAEDEYKRTRQRVAVPGADDNVTAVAALLRAAEMLRDLKPLHDIWLVHFTGEEFPADDLGARKFVSDLLNQKRDISGLVLLDMIGYNESGETLYQINPGHSYESRRIAMMAVDASKDVVPSMLPVVRTRYDNRSYLYNTDGLIFSEAGFPVILFNEHINRLENLMRLHYHQTTDVTKFIDWKYATNIVKVSIETVARLAMESP